MNVAGGQTADVCSQVTPDRQLGQMLVAHPAPPRPARPAAALTCRPAPHLASLQAGTAPRPVMAVTLRGGRVRAVQCCGTAGAGPRPSRHSLVNLSLWNVKKYGDPVQRRAKPTNGRRVR